MMLNTNTASNPLAGTLRINGVSHQSSANNVTNPLMRGLRISKQNVEPSSAASQNAVEQASKEEAKQKLIQNFETTLLSRLEKTENPNAKEKTPADTRAEEAKVLANSITATIEQIKKEFGKEAANEVMANILTSTEDGVTADKIANAIGSVFAAFANSAKEAATSATATPDDLAKADETNKKLEKMVKFLNAGEPDKTDGEKSALTGALNEFFGMNAFEEDDRDRFTADFKWISRNEEIENEKAKGHKEKDFYLTFEELGKENTDRLINFLRNDLGDEAAAQYIESLGEDADVFEAITDLRDMFYEDSEKVGYFNNSTDFKLARHEGPGMDKIEKLTDFLNDNMLDEVNRIIRDDAGVHSRFLEMAAKKFDSSEDIPATYGLAAWPSMGLGTIANGDHLWETRFTMTDMGETTAEERKIMQIKGSADFNRVLAESDPAKKEQYLAAASRQDAAYEDAMAAYKAKTMPPTPHGSMVEAEA